MTIVRSSQQTKLAGGLVTAVVGTVTICGSLLSTAALADDQAQQSANSGPQQTPAAPSAASAAPIEQVTVTGTRIKRRDLQSTSPIVTIDSSQIEQRAGLNLEDYLNQLPNYNPAQTPTTENQDVQPSAVNTVGIATISLYGLGPNRGLVLIDGHRTVPVNALMETDVNTIPSSMIDRVEIITGGASAVYGADAVAGVTNFITKKNFQGVQLDVQDGLTEVGDGNELRANALLGTKIGDNQGNIIMGMEYYNHEATYEANRSFFTNAWYNDPTVAGSDLFVYGYNGYQTAIAPPSAAAASVLLPNTAANGTPFPYGSFGVFQSYRFNANSSIYAAGLANSQSNYLGVIGSNGYGLVNEYNPLQANLATATTPPGEVQSIKWNNPDTTASSPQTRYSFFTNGTYNITDDVQFYADARFANSVTDTLLSVPPNASYGWEASVPYNQATDDPIIPGDVTSATTQATLQTIANDFNKYGYTTANPYYNKSYIPITAAGTQHPVPWQLAMLLDSRGIMSAPAGSTVGLSTEFGGPITCNNSVSVSTGVTPEPGPCGLSSAIPPTSWILETYPFSSLQLPGRGTTDTSTSWQIETGFNFPIAGDWTGDVYWSRGQSTDYEQGLGNNSLENWRSVIDSPGYGMNQTFQGNGDGASQNFGTSVPTTCTSGFYDTIFEADAAPSADCQNAISTVLQTETQVQQDDGQVNFQGTVTKDWAGDISAAVGYEYRRVASQFQPDTLQSTNSFINQVIGLYPQASLNQSITDNDGYVEVFLPVLNSPDLPFLQKVNLDLGGRYSDYTGNIPNATTFKVNIDASLTKWLRLRGGYNRAIRAPNLGELYLPMQEIFGGGALYADPCSVRSNSPFGAGGAAPDMTAATGGLGPTHLASGQTQAGAESTYLICQAQMGTNGANYYYTQNTAGQVSTGGGFAWLNEQGTPTLTSEQADTWTGGLVISQLSDNPLISGLSGSVDWYQLRIDHAIELDSPDYANFLCYGTVTVTTVAEAQAQADSPACENVARNQSTGGATTALLSYDNLATIETAGVSFEINWIAQLSDMGIPLPGAFSFSSQDQMLMYYRTKASPENFDVTINWKGSLGPTLAGTDPGAYSYRLFTTIGYVQPSWGVNLSWRFLPSVNQASKAQEEAIIANNNSVARTGVGTILSYTPDTSLAAPAYSLFDLSANWNVNQTWQLRAGVNNLLNTEPAIVAANAGYPVGTNLNTVCSAAAQKEGCVNPTAYSLATDGGGVTSPGFYDVYGRTYFVGVRATF